MVQQHRGNGGKSLLVLGIIWLLGAISDRLWFAFDRTVPAWDQAEYLTGTLNYWQVLQHPQWLSGEWWTNFWLLSTKIPPLVFILTTPFLQVFGTRPDQATLVFLLFSAILLASVYSLGVQLFNQQVGLWAAAICVVLPGLYRFRLQFLLDYPLTAAITLTFFCLTMWKKESGSSATDSVTDVTDVTNRTQLEKRTNKKYKFPPSSTSPTPPLSPSPPVPLIFLLVDRLWHFSRFINPRQTYYRVISIYSNCVVDCRNCATKSLGKISSIGWCFVAVGSRIWALGENKLAVNIDRR